MAALVQTFPQQTGTVTMLARPSSSSGSPSHSQTRTAQTPRAGFTAVTNNTSTYRGFASPQSGQYTFSGAPKTEGSFTRPTPTPHLTSAQRTSSAPAVTLNGLVSKHNPANSSVSTSSSGSSSSHQVSLDDSTIPNRTRVADVHQRPYSTISLNTNLPPMFPHSSNASPVKPSPDRYRRGHRRAETSGPTTSTTTTMTSSPSSTIPGQTYASQHASNVRQLPTFQSFRGSNNTVGAGNPTRFSSVDDMQLYQRQNSDLAKRYRRRSMGPGPFDMSQTSSNFAAETMSALGVAGSATSSTSDLQPPPAALMTTSRNNISSDSISSSRSGSRPGSAARQSPSPAPEPVALPKVETPAATTSSPLAKSSTVISTSTPAKSANPPTQVQRSAPAPAPSSPAAQHLAALHKKDDKKGTKSKLRRAFSFGSSQELKKASLAPPAPNKLEKVPSRPKTRKEAYEEELEAEQAAIARKQEAAGLGESIYSGQGNVFSGSTDNLSISSTASSASIMLRKMGKGMKKGGRSFVGLFRPKSVVGVPAADGPINSSYAQVSMVTVEAEREKVNINANPHDQIGGGTGYPKLERNSIDAASATVDGQGSARASIMGGDRERAEVLAAVRKGILKRQCSP